jgi:hypothetical protein
MEVPASGVALRRSPMRVKCGDMGVHDVQRMKIE